MHSLLKRLNQILFIKLSLFRSSVPEVFFKKDALQTWKSLQKNNNVEAWYQQSHFATLLKPHLRTDTPLKTHSTSAEESSLGEYLWGTASACQQNFKRIKLQFVFIYSYKKKFINTNNEQINK